MEENELGRFIRSRREALSPTAVGLPVGLRRRTPGLRRAELATIAGMSVDYLVRLEQGRDRRPSAQVLAALADALRLEEPDRDHLRMLALITHTGELCPAPTRPATAVRPTVQALLDRLDPAPAYVTNRLTDVLAWNGGYERLAGPLGILDADVPNLAAYTFTDPRARQAYRDWDTVVDRHLGEARSGCRPDDPGLVDLVDRLASAGDPGFDQRWQSVDISPRRSGQVHVIHPEVGELRLEFEDMVLPDIDHQRLVVHLPADDATATALDRLVGRRPGALRSVTA